MTLAPSSLWVDARTGSFRVVPFPHSLLEVPSAIKCNDAHSCRSSELILDAGDGQGLLAAAPARKAVVQRSRTRVHSLTVHASSEQDCTMLFEQTRALSQMAVSSLCLDMRASVLSLGNLASLAGLTSLKLQDVAHLSLNGISSIAPLLTDLRLTHCRVITGGEGLTGLAKLTNLMLDRADRGLLAVVATLTSLTGVSLLRMGSVTDLCQTVRHMTGLKHLGLVASREGTSNECQSALDVAAEGIGFLQSLYLLVPYDCTLPLRWNAVPRMNVYDTTQLPTSGTTHLVLKHNLKSGEPGEPGVTTLSKDLTHLHMAPHYLTSALNCSGLTDLVIIPPAPEHRDARTDAWAGLNPDHGLWENLRHLAFVPKTGVSQVDGHPYWCMEPPRIVFPSFDKYQPRTSSASDDRQEWMKQKREVERQDWVLQHELEIFSSLRYFFSYRRITHLTLFLLRQSDVSLSSLLDMPTLQSVTLVGVTVKRSDVLSLARLPEMRVIELINVLGFSRTDCERGGWLGSVVVHFRDLACLLMGDQGYSL